MATKQYIKLDPIEHILLRPETYCGSVVARPQLEYVFHDGKLYREIVQYSPALVRCFLEILSNATDNVARDTIDIKQTKIVVEISKTTISILNDGATIPIEINKIEKMYNHTLIFGNLLTGSNYDDKEQRITVGRNGIGAKLTNIFSTKFTVEGVDSDKGLKFVQTWTNNMKKVGDPCISKSKSKNYTKITFDLDLKRFPGITGIPTLLFARFTLDAAMTTGLKVTFNCEKLPNNIDLYLNLIVDDTITYEKNRVCKVVTIGPTRIWISISPKEIGFEQISFVNGLRTKDGGKHVDAAVEAVCRPIANKFNITIRDVKPFFRFLVVSTVINPEFNGQEKNILESPNIKLDDIPTPIINKLLKLTDENGATINTLLKSRIEDKAKKVLVKTVASKGVSIEGYDRANFAGTSKSNECILIICEGLSAKTFAVAGIEKGIYGKKGRNYFGIYPLRGKLLNTRNASITAISKNIVITNLVRILGLDFSKPNNISKLSYGKLCLLTDADVDGIHIEGLVLNFIHSMFPILLDTPFVISMKTPIFKTITNKLYTFYYDEQSIRDINLTKLKVKYYKGLGTTKPEDVKDIFGKKVLEFYTDKQTDYSFEIAFDKSHSADRKAWIEAYDSLLIKPTLDDNNNALIPFSVTKHLNEELIKYFIDDCSRTLPSVYDGLKESQRKVLYAAKKRNLISDVKVAQFGAYVAEHTGYHHGENNLFGTIINMAQSFPGTNNIPLLSDEGTFGTRLSGGDDAANPRYIYTKLTKACLELFPNTDEYEQKIKEGDIIEPPYYVPILPTLLINGCLGIATGWMCSCPSFNPEDVKINARKAIRGLKLDSIKPWYNGFTGEIVDVGDGKYETKGIYIVKTIANKKTIIVTELPIGMWNDKFKIACEENESIINIKDDSTIHKPNYTLTVNDSFKEDVFVKKLLVTTVNVNNIVVFDKNNKIIKVSVNDVFKLWAKERIERNGIRKHRLISLLKIEELNLTERIKFIELVRSKVLILTAAEDVIITKMKANGLSNIKLLDLSVRNLTEEKRLECIQKLQKTTEERKLLEQLTPEDMWENDLKQFEKYY